MDDTGILAAVGNLILVVTLLIFLGVLCIVGLAIWALFHIFPFIVAGILSVVVILFVILSLRIFH